MMFIGIVTNPCIVIEEQDYVKLPDSIKLARTLKLSFLAQSILVFFLNFRLRELIEAIFFAICRVCSYFLVAVIIVLVDFLIEQK